MHPMPSGFDTNTMDTSNNYNAQRPRHDSNALLMLPAPLSANRPLLSSTSLSRTSEDNSDSASFLNQRLIPSPQSIDHESFDSSASGHRLASPPGNVNQYESPRQRSSHTHPSSDPQNPFRSIPTSPSSYDDSQQAYVPDYGGYGDESPGSGNGNGGNRMSGGRGVRLTDGGPVPGPEGVRRVSRQLGRRPTSQVPPTNRYSRSSTTAFGLPPGAAPPQPQY